MFESMTHASVKDCINEEGRLIFIVNKGEIAKAIGKGGVNIKKIERMINKRVKIVEFSEDMLEFVRNVIAPLKVADIADNEGTVVITSPDSQTRGLLIGRGAVNLRNFENIVKRYYDIKEIRVT